MEDQIYRFSIGDKVRLNIDEIRKQPGWEIGTGFNSKYRNWVESNYNNEYTVTNNSSVCSLSNNNVEIPWIFWEGFLSYSLHLDIDDSYDIQGRGLVYVIKDHKNKNFTLGNDIYINNKHYKIVGVEKFEIPQYNEIGKLALNVMKV